MNNIIQLLKQAGRGTGLFFNTLFKQKGIKRYIVLFFVLSLVFTFFIFPYNKLAYSFIRSAEIPGIETINITGLDISPTGKVSADLLELLTRKRTSYQLVQPDLSFAPLGILLKKNLNARLEAEEVSIEGKSSTSAKKLSIQTNLELNKETSIPERGKLNFSLKNVFIEGFTLKGIPMAEMIASIIPNVSFSTVQAEIDFGKDLITLTRFQFTGKDLKGRITGSIQINPESFRSSQCNLAITLKSDSALLEKNKMFISGYLNPSSGDLIINLTGPLSKPKPKFVR